ncbi:MAG: purine-nucleoside phosphorylase [Polyangiaceae bacterium]
MSALDPQLAEALRSVTALGSPPPDVGVVLGSGLGAFGDQLADLRKVPYAQIPNMPESAVVGHAGNLCLGAVGSARVACLQGRVHLYEGHSLERATFGVRLLAALGCRVVVLTNAAGGVNEHFQAGDLMLITDHLNLTGRNPLVGPNPDGLPRFPDMTEAYDSSIRAAARQAAKESGAELREGVYAALLGPSYETPAEIRMLRTLGADAVGMSTVIEVLSLRHRGVRVGAMSCITNMAAGMSGAPLDHAEVEQIAKQSRATFVGVLTRWLQRCAELTRA